MLSRSEKQQLRQLLSSPQWKTFELLAQQFCAKVESDSVIHDSEWDTIKATLLKEGQVRGIRNLMQEAIMAAANE